MNYGILPVVGKNNLRSIVSVTDAGEYLLVYVISMGKAVKTPGIGDRVKESFANRSHAIMKWFENRANIAYKKQ